MEHFAEQKKIKNMINLRITVINIPFESAGYGYGKIVWAEQKQLKMFYFFRL